MARKRVLLTVLMSLLTMAGVLTAPTAAAEDDCSGSFVDFPAMSQIRCATPENPTWEYFWLDRDEDSNETMLHLVGCNGNPDITLKRWNGVTGEWESFGTKRFYCLNSDSGWKSWGRVVYGYYHFEITAPRTSSPDGLDVSYFHGAW